MAVSAVLFSTEAEFDAATRTAIASYLGLMRFAAHGRDCSSTTGWTSLLGTWYASNGKTIQLAAENSLDNILTLNGTSAFADGTVRARATIEVHGTFTPRGGLAFRVVDGSNFYCLQVNATALSLQRIVASAYTQLTSVAATYSVATTYDWRVVTSGTSLTVYDDTQSVSAGATDATHASGSVGFFGLWSQPEFHALRVDSSATSGTASLPTSTTYVDLGTAKRMGSVTWEEDLSNGGDVTVDVYGSNDGASDAASVTGLTDPAGSDCSAAGSHRYWRVVVNFTRSTTAQEPTVSRVALAQVPAAAAAAGGGSVGSRRPGSLRESE